MGKVGCYVIDALDPSDPNGVEVQSVWIEQAQIEGLTRCHLTARFHRLRLLPEVLKKPTVVFGGLERPSQEEGICYVGRPPHDFPKERIEVPAPPGKVFLVFVTESGKVFDWRWEKSDTEKPDYPEKWEERFRRILWTTPKR